MTDTTPALTRFLANKGIAQPVAAPAFPMLQKLTFNGEMATRFDRAVDDRVSYEVRWSAINGRIIHHRDRLTAVLHDREFEARMALLNAQIVESRRRWSAVAALTQENSDVG